MLSGHSFLGWIIVGFLAGALAKFIMPGKDPGGCIVTTLLGVAGAVVAGYLGQMFGLYEEGAPVGFIAAVVGAFILLFLYRLVIRGRS